MAMAGGGMLDDYLTWGGDEDQDHPRWIEPSRTSSGFDYNQSDNQVNVALNQYHEGVEPLGSPTDVTPKKTKRKKTPADGAAGTESDTHSKKKKSKSKQTASQENLADLPAEDSYTIVDSQDLSGFELQPPSSQFTMESADTEADSVTQETRELNPDDTHRSQKENTPKVKKKKKMKSRKSLSTSADDLSTDADASVNIYDTADDYFSALDAYDYQKQVASYNAVVGDLKEQFQSKHIPSDHVVPEMLNSVDDVVMAEQLHTAESHGDIQNPAESTQDNGAGFLTTNFDTEQPQSENGLVIEADSHTASKPTKKKKSSKRSKSQERVLESKKDHPEDSQENIAQSAGELMLNESDTSFRILSETESLGFSHSEESISGKGSNKKKKAKRKKPSLVEEEPSAIDEALDSFVYASGENDIQWEPEASVGEDKNDTVFDPVSNSDKPSKKKEAIESMSVLLDVDANDVIKADPPTQTVAAEDTKANMDEYLTPELQITTNKKGIARKGKRGRKSVMAHFQELETSVSVRQPSDGVDVERDSTSDAPNQCIPHGETLLNGFESSAVDCLDKDIPSPTDQHNMDDLDIHIPLPGIHQHEDNPPVKDTVTKKKKVKSQKSGDTSFAKTMTDEGKKKAKSCTDLYDNDKFTVVALPFGQSEDVRLDVTSVTSSDKTGPGVTQTTSKSAKKSKKSKSLNQLSHTANDTVASAIDLKPMMNDTTTSNDISPENGHEFGVPLEALKVQDSNSQDDSGATQGNIGSTIGSTMNEQCLDDSGHAKAQSKRKKKSKSIPENNNDTQHNANVLDGQSLLYDTEIDAQRKRKRKSTKKVDGMEIEDTNEAQILANVVNDLNPILISDIDQYNSHAQCNPHSISDPQSVQDDTQLGIQKKKKRKSAKTADESDLLPEDIDQQLHYGADHNQDLVAQPVKMPSGQKNQKQVKASQSDEMADSVHVKSQNEDQVGTTVCSMDVDNDTVQYDKPLVLMQEDDNMHAGVAVKRKKQGKRAKKAKSCGDLLADVVNETNMDIHNTDKSANSSNKHASLGNLPTEVEKQNEPTQPLSPEIESEDINGKSKSKKTKRFLGKKEKHTKAEKAKSCGDLSSSDIPVPLGTTEYIDHNVVMPEGHISLSVSQSGVQENQRESVDAFHSPVDCSSEQVVKPKRLSKRPKKVKSCGNIGADDLNQDEVFSEEYQIDDLQNQVLPKDDKKKKRFNSKDEKKKKTKKAKSCSDLTDNDGVQDVPINGESEQNSFSPGVKDDMASSLQDVVNETNMDIHNTDKSANSSNTHASLGNLHTEEENQNAPTRPLSPEVESQDISGKFKSKKTKRFLGKKEKHTKAKKAKSCGDLSSSDIPVLLGTNEYIDHNVTMPEGHDLNQDEAFSEEYQIDHLQNQVLPKDDKKKKRFNSKDEKKKKTKKAKSCSDLTDNDGVQDVPINGESEQNCLQDSKPNLNDSPMAAYHDIIDQVNEDVSRLESLSDEDKVNTIVQEFHPALLEAQDVLFGPDTNDDSLMSISSDLDLSFAGTLGENGTTFNCVTHELQDSDRTKKLRKKKKSKAIKNSSNNDEPGEREHYELDHQPETTVLVEDVPNVQLPKNKDKRKNKSSKAKLDTLPNSSQDIHNDGHISLPDGSMLTQSDVCSNPELSKKKKQKKSKQFVSPDESPNQLIDPTASSIHTVMNDDKGNLTIDPDFAEITSIMTNLDFGTTEVDDVNKVVQGQTDKKKTKSNRSKKDKTSKGEEPVPQTDADTSINTNSVTTNTEMEDNLEPLCTGLNNDTMDRPLADDDKATSATKTTKKRKDTSKQHAMSHLDGIDASIPENIISSEQSIDTSTPHIDFTVERSADVIEGIIDVETVKTEKKKKKKKVKSLGSDIDVSTPSYPNEDTLTCSTSLQDEVSINSLEQLQKHQQPDENSAAMEPEIIPTDETHMKDKTSFEDLTDISQSHNDISNQDRPDVSEETAEVDSVNTDKKKKRKKKVKSLGNDIDVSTPSYPNEDTLTCSTSLQDEVSINSLEQLQKHQQPDENNAAMEPEIIPTDETHMKDKTSFEELMDLSQSHNGISNQDRPDVSEETAEVDSVNTDKKKKKKKKGKSTSNVIKVAAPSYPTDAACVGSTSLQGEVCTDSLEQNQQSEEISAAMGVGIIPIEETDMKDKKSSEDLTSHTGISYHDCPDILEETTEVNSMNTEKKKKKKKKVKSTSNVADVQTAIHPIEKPSVGSTTLQVEVGIESLEQQPDIDSTATEVKIPPTEDPDMKDKKKRKKKKKPVVAVDEQASPHVNLVDEVETLTLDDPSNFLGRGILGERAVTGLGYDLSGYSNSQDPEHLSTPLPITDLEPNNGNGTNVVESDAGTVHLPLNVLEDQTGGNSSALSLIPKKLAEKLAKLRNKLSNIGNGKSEAIDDGAEPEDADFEDDFWWPDDEFEEEEANPTLVVQLQGTQGVDQYVPFRRINELPTIIEEPDEGANIYEDIGAYGEHDTYMTPRNEAIVLDDLYDDKEYIYCDINDAGETQDDTEESDYLEPVVIKQLRDSVNDQNEIAPHIQDGQSYLGDSDHEDNSHQYPHLYGSGYDGVTCLVEAAQSEVKKQSPNSDTVTEHETLSASSQEYIPLLSGGGSCDAEPMKEDGNTEKVLIGSPKRWRSLSEEHVSDSEETVSNEFNFVGQSSEFTDHKSGLAISTDGVCQHDVYHEEESLGDEYTEDDLMESLTEADDSTLKGYDPNTDINESGSIGSENQVTVIPIESDDLQGTHDQVITPTDTTSEATTSILQSGRVISYSSSGEDDEESGVEGEAPRSTTDTGQFVIDSMMPLAQDDALNEKESPKAVVEFLDSSSNESVNGDDASFDSLSSRPINGGVADFTNPSRESYLDSPIQQCDNGLPGQIPDPSEDAVHEELKESAHPDQDEPVGDSAHQSDNEDAASSGEATFGDSDGDIRTDTDETGISVALHPGNGIQKQQEHFSSSDEDDTLSPKWPSQTNPENPPTDTPDVAHDEISMDEKDSAVVDVKVDQMLDSGGASDGSDSADEEIAAAQLDKPTRTVPAAAEEVLRLDNSLADDDEYIGPEHPSVTQYNKLTLQSKAPDSPMAASGISQQLESTEIVSQSREIEGNFPSSDIDLASPSEQGTDPDASVESPKSTPVGSDSEAFSDEPKEDIHERHQNAVQNYIDSILQSARTKIELLEGDEEENTSEQYPQEVLQRESLVEDSGIGGSVEPLWQIQRYLQETESSPSGQDDSLTQDGVQKPFGDDFETTQVAEEAVQQPLLITSESSDDEFVSLDGDEWKQAVITGNESDLDPFASPELSQGVSEDTLIATNIPGVTHVRSSNGVGVTLTTSIDEHKPRQARNNLTQVIDLLTTIEIETLPNETSVVHVETPSQTISLAVEDASCQTALDVVDDDDDVTYAQTFQESEMYHYDCVPFQEIQEQDVDSLYSRSDENWQQLEQTDLSYLESVHIQTDPTYLRNVATEIDTSFTSPSDTFAGQVAYSDLIDCNNVDTQTSQGQNDSCTQVAHCELVQQEEYECQTFYTNEIDTQTILNESEESATQYDLEGVVNVNTQTSPVKQQEAESQASGVSTSDFNSQTTERADSEAQSCPISLNDCTTQTAQVEVNEAGCQGQFLEQFETQQLAIEDTLTQIPVFTFDRTSQTSYLETRDAGSQSFSAEATESHSQTPQLQTKNTESQSFSIEATESDSQTPHLETKDAESQSFSVEATENNSQTPQLETKNTESQSFSVEATESESQTPHLETKDTESQSFSVESTASDSQTPHLETKDTGSQSFSVEANESDSQTPHLQTKDAESQSFSVEATESDSQTPQLETKNTESQSFSVEATESDSQTPYLQTKDAESQSFSVEATESDSQTPHLETKDTDSQSLSIEATESYSQTSHLETKDAESQSSSIAATDSISQTLQLQLSDVECQSIIAATSERDSQTALPVNQAVQSDGPDTSFASTSAHVDTRHAAVQSISLPHQNIDTQTSSPASSDAVCQSVAFLMADGASQTKITHSRDVDCQSRVSPLRNSFSQTAIIPRESRDCQSVTSSAEWMQTDDVEVDEHATQVQQTMIDPADDIAIQTDPRITRPEISQGVQTVKPNKRDAFTHPLTGLERQQSTQVVTEDIIVTAAVPVQTESLFDNVVTCGVQTHDMVKTTSLGTQKDPDSPRSVECQTTTTDTSDFYDNHCQTTTDVSLWRETGTQVARRDVARFVDSFSQIHERDLTPPNDMSTQVQPPLLSLHSEQSSQVLSSDVTSEVHTQTAPRIPHVRDCQVQADCLNSQEEYTQVEAAQLMKHQDAHTSADLSDDHLQAQLDEVAFQRDEYRQRWQEVDELCLQQQEALYLSQQPTSTPCICHQETQVTDADLGLVAPPSFQQERYYTHRHDFYFNKDIKVIPESHDIPRVNQPVTVELDAPQLSPKQPVTVDLEPEQSYVYRTKTAPQIKPPVARVDDDTDNVAELYRNELVLDAEVASEDMPAMREPRILSADSPRYKSLYKKDNLEPSKVTQSYVTVIALHKPIGWDHVSPTGADPTENDVLDRVQSVRGHPIADRPLPDTKKPAGKGRQVPGHSWPPVTPSSRPPQPPPYIPAPAYKRPAALPPRVTAASPVSFPSDAESDQSQDSTAFCVTGAPLSSLDRYRGERRSRYNQDS